MNSYIDGMEITWTEGHRERYGRVLAVLGPPITLLVEALSGADFQPGAWLSVSVADNLIQRLHRAEWIETELRLVARGAGRDDWAVIGRLGTFQEGPGKPIVYTTTVYPWPLLPKLERAEGRYESRRDAQTWIENAVRACGVVVTASTE